MLKFNATIGVNPGYDTVRNADNETVAVKIVGSSWRGAMDMERAKTGIMVSAQLSLVRLVYPVDLGCPSEGEVAVSIEGRMNPHFDKDERAWQVAVINILEALRVALGQERVSVEFSKNETFVYLGSASVNELIDFNL